MYSPFIRVILAMIGLSPVLLSLYVVNLINNYSNLHFSFQLKSVSQVGIDLLNLLETHYLLIIFVFLFLLSRWLVHYAIRNLSVGRIEIKSLKPADTNFVQLLVSAILPFFKLVNHDFPDMVYIIGFFMVAIVYGVAMKASYHFNLILKLFLGYSHYEVVTMGDVGYIMLTKQKLINKNMIKEYVSLTDHMLIDRTNKT
jgi:hypothetical protein